jgi:DeoR/GlpR family transcriptional regulator of sugar metabolism
VVGLINDVLAGRGRIHKGFIGAHAVSAERGVMDMALEEVQAKQHFAAHCSELYGLVDSSKFGSFSLHTATPLSQVTALYTGAAADPAVVAAIERAGTRVHRVAVSEEHR